MLRCVLLSVAVFVSLTGPAQACRCRPPDPPKKSLESSLGVFAGKVTETKVEDLFLFATVTVSKSWKGEPAKTVTVRTPSSSAACGFGFKTGGQYLIYCTGEKDGVWATNLCTRTRRLADAEDDVKALGDGEMIDE